MKHGATADGRQHRRIPARRIHPQRRFLAADRAAQAHHRGRCRRATRRISSMPRGIATALFGQSIGANMFMVGYAYQLGAMPLSAAAIEQAIELNGEAVAMNQAAFHWGRRAAVDRAAVEKLAKPATAIASDARQLSRILRRDGRAAGRIPHRLSERGLCGALPRPGRQGQGGRGRARARQVRAGRRGGALSVQADGLQGRVRGGAALHRRRIPQAGRDRVRRRQSALRISSRAAAVGAPRQDDRPAAQDELRPVDAAGVPAAGEAQRSCAARRSIRSAVRSSAAPSAS